MSWLAHHPAPGFGDLLPGSFVVPQNPITAGGRRYIPKIGEILPGRFTVPQNPLISTLRAGVKSLAGGAGMGGCCCSGTSSGASSAVLNGSPLPEAEAGLQERLGSVDWLTVAIAAGVGFVLAKGASAKGRK